MQDHTFATTPGLAPALLGLLRPSFLSHGLSPLPLLSPYAPTFSLLHPGFEHAPEYYQRMEDDFDVLEFTQ